MAYINETSGVTIGVRYACSNTGVALRILYRAFRERFGIGPKAYLLQQRLSNARAELLRAARFTQHRTYAHCRCGPAPIPYMRHPANQPGS
jgi:methylphosphotriester-DNA--protein-cysteine methyltransferase